MKSKLKHYAKELLFFIIFITIFTNILSLYKSTDLNKESLKLEKVQLIDNSFYTIKKDKPLLIHFWATWCPTCKLEAQNIQYLTKYYNVLTIAVNSGSTQEIQKYMKEHQLTFNVLNDTDALYAKRFQIKAYPTTFIYDKNKKLVFSEVGYTSTIGLFLRMWWTRL